MKNYMITAEKVLEEKFNSCFFCTDTIEPFLIFYMQILDFACKTEIISEKRRDSISEVLLSTISKKVNNKAIPMVNSLYVITLWLSSMKPWDAWKELEKIQDVKSASEFVGKSDKWIKNEILKLKLLLTSVKSTVLSIKNGNLMVPYTSIESMLIKFNTYDISTALNLKEEHQNKNKIIFCNYFFMKDIVGENYLDFLRLTVESFCREVGIIEKINSNDVLTGLMKEAEKRAGENRISQAKVDSIYKERIKLAKTEYSRMIRLAEAFDEIYATLTEEEQLSISDSILKKFDKIQIDNEYNEKVKSIQEEWEESERKLEKIFEMNTDIEEDISINCGVTLSYLAGEYALFSRIKKGNIEYPQNQAEKVFLKEILGKRDTINELLDSNIEFSDSEIEYLESCKE